MAVGVLNTKKNKKIKKSADIFNSDVNDVKQ